MNNVRNWLLGTLVLIAATTAILVAIAPDGRSAQSATTIPSVYSAS